MTCRTAKERRASQRSKVEECTWFVAARLRPGRDIKVLDLSNGGALIEASVRLLPGASFVMQLTDIGGEHTIRGTVLRCYVSALDRDEGVRYRAALEFDQRFRFPEGHGRALTDAGGDAAMGRTDTGRV